MPWLGDGTVQRTDGTRDGATTWEQARLADETINSSDHDTHDEDLANAIENCVARDGQNAPSADLPMGGNKHTGVGDATANDHYAAYGQVLSLALPFVPPASVGGTANAITLSPTPAETQYVTGRGFRFFAEAANTGAVTLKVSSLAAVSLRRADGAVFAADELPTGRHITAIYNGSVFISDVPAPAAAPGNTGLTQQQVDERIRQLVIDPAEVGVGGTFPPELIPALTAAYIASGVLDLARIPGIDLSRIPDLPASQTTSGVFDQSRVGSSPAEGKFLKAQASGGAVWGDAPAPFSDGTERIRSWTIRNSNLPHTPRLDFPVPSPRPEVGDRITAVLFWSNGGSSAPTTETFRFGYGNNDGFHSIAGLSDRVVTISHTPNGPGAMHLTGVLTGVYTGSLSITDVWLDPEDTWPLSASVRGLMFFTY